jgi:hypothetical protein
MSFTGNYTCNSFKSGLINGDFDFDTDTIKMALYTNAATLNEDTAAYIDDPTTGEVSAPGYTDGGVTLTVEKGLTNNTAFISFENVTISAAFTARGALIYKDGGAAICVLDFGSDKTSTNTFIVTFPTASSADALIRLT